jgi:serine/threonine protein kinase
MESLRHPSIVMFLGACTKFPNLAIVLEFCSNKSLWSVLQNKSINLSWEDRKRIATEIAQGMNYLHSSATPVIHRDLKSLNILLDDCFRAKIADFGWTRLKGEKMTNKIGTFQWMAPEVINGENYTEKADVFSYGIILWEIAAREPPYKNIMGTKVSLDVIKYDLRPEIPPKTPDLFAKLMKRCWVL